MEKIKTQAALVWQLLSASETYAVYQSAISTTWAILKEAGLLIWLVICLTLVFGDWFWKTGVGAGQSARAWFNNLQEGSSDQLASETGKALMTVGKSSLLSTLSLAKTQLGIEDTTPAPAPAPKASEVKPEPPAAKPAPAPAAAAPATPSVEKTEEEA
jgi:hypothetical protein